MSDIKRLENKTTLTTKEIAKKIRQNLKALKGYKFSVTTEYYSGGSSINVNVMKSPIRMNPIKGYDYKIIDLRDLSQVWS